MLSNNQLDYIDELIENAKYSKSIKLSKIKEICSSDESDYNSVIRMFEDENISVIDDCACNDDYNECLEDATLIDDPDADSATLKAIEDEINQEFEKSDDNEQKYQRYYYSTQTYLNDISDIPLLTAEEEVHNARLVQDGILASKELASNHNLSNTEISSLNYKIEAGEFARDLMFNSNTKLVVSVAKKYLCRGIELNDAIQEGSYGLLRAIEKFDYTKGFKFSTYAYYWIGQSIQRAIANNGRSVRLPVHQVELINRMNAREIAMQIKLGRNATDEELAKDLGITVENVHKLKIQAQKPKSLDAPIGEDEEDSFGETVEDENTCSALEYAIIEDRKDRIQYYLSKLTAQEREVIELRYGFIDRVHTLQEIADMRGLSRERIRQVQEKAERKLKQLSNFCD